MRTHRIKLSKEFAEPVLTGVKKFEIRLNDRGYQTGDRVVFIPTGEELTPEEQEMYDALENLEFEITYIVSGWGLKNGYVVFAISPVSVKAEDGCSVDEAYRAGDLSLALRNLLMRRMGMEYGIKDPTLYEVASVGYKGVKQFKGMGKMKLAELSEVMEKHGISFG